MKHTPFPWHIEENVKAKGFLHYAITNRKIIKDFMIASITPMENLRDIDRANAELIIKLPSYIGALEHIVKTDIAHQCRCEQCQKAYSNAINVLNIH